MSEGTPKNEKTETKIPIKSGDGNSPSEETEEQLFFDFDEYPRRKGTTEEVVSK
jgi:hypothetical protein